LSGIEHYSMTAEGVEAIDSVSRVVHNVLEAYSQAATPLNTPPHSWEESTEEYRESVRRATTLMAENLATTPKGMHDVWLLEKLKHGWVYGDVEDTEAKRHPLCLPYDELGSDHRIRGELFYAVVSELING